MAFLIHRAVYSFVPELTTSVAHYEHHVEVSNVVYQVRGFGPYNQPWKSGVLPSTACTYRPPVLMLVDVQYVPKSISDIRLLFDRVDTVLAHVPSATVLNVRFSPSSLYFLSSTLGSTNARSGEGSEGLGTNRSIAIVVGHDQMTTNNWLWEDFYFDDGIGPTDALYPQALTTNLRLTYATQADAQAGTSPSTHRRRPIPHAHAHDQRSLTRAPRACHDRRWRVGLPDVDGPQRVGAVGPQDDRHGHDPLPHRGHLVVGP